MKTTAEERAEWRKNCDWFDGPGEKESVPWREVASGSVSDFIRLLDDADELARLRDGLRELLESPEYSSDIGPVLTVSDVAALLGDE